MVLSFRIFRLQTLPLSHQSKGQDHTAIKLNQWVCWSTTLSSNNVRCEGFLEYLHLALWLSLRLQIGLNYGSGSGSFFPDWIGLDLNFEDSEQLWTLNSGCISVVGFASEFILNWTKWHASTPRLSLRHLEMREPEVQACNANVKLIQHTTPFLLVWMWVILRFTSVKLKNRTEPELWTIKWQWKWKCPIYTKHSKHLLWTNGVVANKIWFSSQQWAAMTYS